MCSILRTGFRAPEAGTRTRNPLRFGYGIYSTATSSKANDYTDTFDAGVRTMFVVHVVAGKACRRVESWTATDGELTAPPPGYDSVLGMVASDWEGGPMDDGGHETAFVQNPLNHDELVVYNSDATLPAYLVMYDATCCVDACDNHVLGGQQFRREVRITRTPHTATERSVSYQCSQCQRGPYCAACWSEQNCSFCSGACGSFFCQSCCPAYHFSSEAMEMYCKRSCAPPGTQFLDDIDGHETEGTAHVSAAQRLPHSMTKDGAGGFGRRPSAALLADSENWPYVEPGAFGLVYVAEGEMTGQLVYYDDDDDDSDDSDEDDEDDSDDDDEGEGAPRPSFDTLVQAVRSLRADRQTRRSSSAFPPANDIMNVANMLATVGAATKAQFRRAERFLADEPSGDAAPPGKAVIYVGQVLTGPCYSLPMRALRQPPFRGPVVSMGDDRFEDGTERARGRHGDGDGDGDDGDSDNGSGCGCGGGSFSRPTRTAVVAPSASHASAVAPAARVELRGESGVAERRDAWLER